MKLPRLFLLIFCMISISFAEDDALKKWKAERAAEKKQYKKQVDAELSSYKKRVEKERKEWMAYVNNVRSKWGKYTDSTPKAWAEYGNDLNSLSIVDFDKNAIEIEVLDDGSSQKKAEEIFAKRFDKILNTKDGNTNKSILNNQIKYNNKPVTNRNKDKYIKEMVKKSVKKEVVIGNDGRARTKYKITLNLVPNSIQIRAKKYMDLIDKYCKKENIDPALILALMHTESAFNSKAFSRRPDGTPMACGLLQLIPTQAARDAYRALWKKDKIVKPEFLYIPDNNIKMGVWYVKNLTKWWNKKEKKYTGSIDPTKTEYFVISSYNQGMGTIYKQYKRKNYFKKSSATSIYSNLSTDRAIREEGRNYIKRVVKREKLYKK